MPFLGAGFHTIDRMTYQGDPCQAPSLSASMAKVIAEESPAHAWWLHPRGGGGRRESSAAMDRGTALDSLLLGGDTQIAVLPEEFGDFKTKAAQALRDQAEAAGQLPMIAHKYAELAEKANAIRAALAELGIVFDGINQQTIVWEEKSSFGPITCRGRLDHLKGTIENPLEILDLKIIKDANPAALEKEMYDLGHHIQGTAYPRGIGRLVPEAAGRIDMTFVYVVPEAPYIDNITIASPDATGRALGTFQWERAIEAWGRGVYTGNWPGWGRGKLLIPPRPYMTKVMEAAVAGGSAGVSF